MRAYLPACIALTCLPSHAMATLAVQAQTCSPLLMEAECDQYHLRLRQAASESQRREIALEYEAVVNERQRFCPLLLLAPAKSLSLGIARPGE